MFVFSDCEASVPHDVCREWVCAFVLTSMESSLTDPQQTRLRGWEFALFNTVMGLAHMLVLFNAGSYVALLPHAAGDLGGVAGRSPPKGQLSGGPPCPVAPSP